MEGKRGRKETVRREKVGERMLRSRLAHFPKGQKGSKTSRVEREKEYLSIEKEGGGGAGGEGGGNIQTVQSRERGSPGLCAREEEGGLPTPTCEETNPQRKERRVRPLGGLAFFQGKRHDYTSELGDKSMRGAQ